MHIETILTVQVGYDALQSVINIPDGLDGGGGAIVDPSQQRRPNLNYKLIQLTWKFDRLLLMHCF